MIKETMWKYLNMFEFKRKEPNIDTLIYYFQKLNFLISTDESFRNLYFAQISHVIYSAYQSNNPAKGEAYLSILRDASNQFTDSAFYKECIGHAYAEIAAYFYRQHQYQKAMDYVNEGLKLAPGNDDLLQKKKYVKERLN